MSNPPSSSRIVHPGTLERLPPVGEAVSPSLPPEMHRPGGSDFQPGCRLHRKAHPGQDRAGDRTALLEPCDEQVVLKQSEESEPPSQGNRPRVPDPDSDKRLRIRGEEQAAVSSRAPPEGESPGFERRLRPSEPNRGFLDPTDRVAVEPPKKVPPALQGQPTGRRGAEEAPRPQIATLEHRQSLCVRGNPLISGMPKFGTNAEVIPRDGAQPKEAKHTVRKRIPGAIDLVRRSGDFPCLEPPVSGHQGGQDPECFQFVDDEIRLRFLLEEDFRAGAQGYRRECQNHPHRQCGDARHRQACRQTSPPLRLKDCVPIRKKNRKMNLTK